MRVEIVEWEGVVWKVFPYGQYINGIVIYSSFVRFAFYEIEIVIYEKFAQMQQ